MSELDEYHQNLMADIRREADASGIFPVEAFFDRMTDRLTEAGELEVADRAYFQSGEGGQKLRIDGYAGDPRDSEGVLGLIVCDFADSDNVQTFGKGDVPPILNPLIRFLKKAKTEEFRDSLNEANPAFQVSDLIITTWAQVTKVKLILVSNRQYIGRDDAVKLAEIGDVPITWSVWDLARFERFDLKGSDEIEIDLNGDFGGAIPALKASRSGDALESYLMIIPGSQLASIYDRWGEKLLQGNVRSFLQARAKTNKGIQNTIRNEPELFFPYNNGLSATANAVACEEGSNGLFVTSISNLQIVNGAQTTGSLHAVMKTAAEQLQRVFVQMKLTVVPFDRAEEIVPRISEYANTQNKVNAADFFANHPFHVRMQDFSRDVIFARREGERHDTKWFYERARGQYINARPKTRGRAQTDFDIQFPKPQLFSKTDLAKFEFSAAGHPHIVSRGAQKNFAEFAKDIGETWSKNDAKFDELWYRRLISKAIVFRWLETEIPKQPWYEGGYRANIVTYAMAKVFHDANGEKQVLDLDAIWRRQSVSDALKQALLLAAGEANDVITNPPAGVRNMSEWAKQQACWNGLKGRSLDYGPEFDGCLVLAENARTNERDQRKKKREIDGISAQSEVVNRGADFWREILELGMADRKLTPKDQQILQVCASMPRQLPSELQCKHALSVLERLREQGLVSV
ncbi:AIPR family protein [Rhodobacter sp. HX-7-19]|uniref:AIPR family protein n=1 Tax=Paragemmobacter kunshanensis TaxID=2583234 RepID=A0A6M1UBB1_9RHOB|nr:AIPR family protein [Rhodobacter kunshanensis]NGQ92911.1 AIPR family protein [Rhodobacter kunshanensis]